MKIGIIFGTRPEAIKIAPVYHYLKNKNEEVILIFTGQHETLLNSVLDVFNIEPHITLKIERVNHSLSELTSQLLIKLEDLFVNNPLDYILVQGDTTSAFIGGLIAFYHKIPVGHIEAGLRTDDIYSPFPEEVNRRMISQFATHHFAPTTKSAKNLYSEFSDKSNVFIVGNTSIDAIKLNQKLNQNKFDEIREKYGLKNKKFIIITMHRRESIPQGVISVLNAVKKFCKKYRDVTIIYPVHPNPTLRSITNSSNYQYDNLEFIEPLDYIELSVFLEDCLFLMTDSGGLQEEAPSYGKYTLILRSNTERYEIVEAGLGKLIGTNEETVFKEIENFYLNMTDFKPGINPYGDGTTSEKIYDIIKNFKPIF